ncbi:hypothetical protein [Bernardetia sp. MNP-M8]
MDYNTLNGKVDSSVERKVFYKWQWDTIRKIGVDNTYLEEQK